MSDEKFLEFKMVAQEEGATIAIIEPLVWDKEKTLRISKHGSHYFARVSEMTGTNILRQCIKSLWAN
jgi:hypothetical protein